MINYVKVMFEDEKSNYQYKMNEINVSDNWDPTKNNPKDFGGFNFSTKDKILRWLHRGNILCDVIIPEDASVVEVNKDKGIYRSNKIILTNPRIVTDDMALEFYKISTLPENAYYKALAVVSIMNYKNTALAIFKDKVNKNNIDTVLEEWDDFTNPTDKDNNKLPTNETFELIKEKLNELKV